MKKYSLRFWWKSVPSILGWSVVASFNKALTLVFTLLPLWKSLNLLKKLKKNHTLDRYVAMTSSSVRYSSVNYQTTSSTFRYCASFKHARIASCSATLLLALNSKLKVCLTWKYSRLIKITLAPLCPMVKDLSMNRIQAAAFWSLLAPLGFLWCSRLFWRSIKQWNLQYGMLFEGDMKCFSNWDPRPCC